ncbi:Na+/H+ antiporter subunit E [Desulfonatronovibrio magnus]|uniref:Na+/H+ antiporter subunit E n=1 Tax=Desulfonatronovibrio magnus TaxID=698827 RepID=UPI0005EB30F6|nr:Na+/H+ antiporter subunit E [Desulfonatronovibrio magnus]
MNQTAETAQSETSFFRKHRGIIYQAVLLMALWLILSGRFGLEPIIYGLLSVGAVVWLNFATGTVPMKTGETVSGQCINVYRLIIYTFWLVIEIIKSGFFVAYLILHPKMPINPMIVRFQTKLPNPLARVILGNSITLTPGTLTLDIQEDYFTVHAIVDEVEEDLVSGNMEARVGRLYLQECKAEEMCTDITILDSAVSAKQVVKYKGGSD